jgi:hypothetical protein
MPHLIADIYVFTEREESFRSNSIKKEFTNDKPRKVKFKIYNLFEN